MDSFIIAITAVSPFLVYLLYGFLMRRIGVVDEAFLDKLNGVIFRCFYPFLSFYNIYSIDPGQKFQLSFVLFSGGAVLILIAVLLLVVPRVVKDRAQAGSLIQAIYRSNCVLYALPLSQSIYGTEGAFYSAMVLTLVVPLYNVTAVLILGWFGGQERKSWKQLLLDVLTNPIILGAIAGILFYALRIRLPEGLEKPIDAFNRLTTPMAMFVLGGSLHFSRMGQYKRMLLWGLTLKMVVIPALVMLAAIALHFQPAERFAIFACFATPPAAASYAMASAMGCDGELAGQFVVIGTVISVVTLFLWIFFMGQAGLL